MTVILMAAKADNNVIGHNNSLPWKQRDDMKRFQLETSGHCVIVGRETYDSFPEPFRPLPNRTNIVLTHDTSLEIGGAIVAHSIEEALQIAEYHGDETPFIIGGAQVYREALEKGLIDMMYLTIVHGEPEGDTFFPQYSEDEWRLVSSETFPADQKNQHPYTFQVLERIKE